jgi:hypothetical protein
MKDLAWLILPALACTLQAAPVKQPNIVLSSPTTRATAISACHGNPILKTPNLDRLHAPRERALHRLPRQPHLRADALRAHDRPARVQERRHPHHPRTRADEPEGATTLAAGARRPATRPASSASGTSATRPRTSPRSRGFDEVFIHGAGGIGQTYPGSCGDAPGNTYFDPVIRHNGRFVKTKGYCTDVFFNQAMRWIDEASGGGPFSLHIRPTPRTRRFKSARGRARYTGKVPTPTRRSSSA